MDTERLRQPAQTASDHRDRPSRAPGLDGPVVVVIALLLLIPSTMIFAPLGASGTPANVGGLGLLLLWLFGRLHSRSRLAGGPQPVRTVVLLFGAAVLASCAAAAFRPIVPVETTALDRGVLLMFGCAGLALVTADGLDDLRQVDRIVRWLAAVATVVALAGIVQFTVGVDVRTWLRLPLLTENVRLDAIYDRASFRRVSGTASHPIEFGVMLAMVAPLALHRSLFGAPRSALRRWGPLVAIGVALPMSLSRSAFVTLGVALLLLVPTWPRVIRRRALLVGLGFAVVAQLALPRLLGAITSLFTNAGNDQSIEGRTEDYAIFGRYFTESPVFGRGFFTFLPERYTILDNQYLMSLIDIGLVGALALLALFVIGMGTARGARARSQDEEVRHLGQALAASLAGAMVSFATFDALSFPMVAGTTFLLLGLAGALWRLTRTVPSTG